MARSTANLSDAIDQYLGFLAAKRMAPNTISANKYMLKGALALWGNIQVCNVNARHIDRLFTEKQWAPRTHNTNLQMLNQFLEWCRKQGYMPLNADPTFGWRNMKVPQNESLRLPVEQFAALLDAAEHPRDRAQIAVGLFLFLRGSEIATLRIGDVDFARHTVKIYRHKTKEDDTLPMCSELEAELLAYLNWYRKDQGFLKDEWFLLPAKQPYRWTQDPRTGRALPGPIVTPMLPTRQQKHTYRVPQAALARMGFPTKGEGEHTLRRSGARAYADQLRAQGYDGALLRVASMLGHKDTKQTEHYIGWHLERQQRNEALAGKSMFGDLLATGTVLPFAREA